MSMSSFTQNQNLSLLWDVLMDELQIPSSNTDLRNKVHLIFQSNLGLFTKKASTSSSSLVEKNKQFLSQVVLAVHTLMPQLKDIKRITILDPVAPEVCKIEDFHSIRQNEFEREVELKRLDLEQYFVKPPELQFSDNHVVEEKITAMDALLAEKVAQRNLEIATQFNAHPSTTTTLPETWLTPQETNPASSGKRVSWDDKPPKEEFDIFSRLKRKQSQEEEEEKENEVVTKVYEEQQSAQLPKVAPKEIIRNNKPTDTTTSTSMLVPQTEIVKQLNEINGKIDKLFEMVNTLMLLKRETEIDSETN